MEGRALCPPFLCAKLRAMELLGIFCICLTMCGGAGITAVVSNDIDLSEGMAIFSMLFGIVLTVVATFAVAAAFGIH